MKVEVKTTNNEKETFEIEETITVGELAGKIMEKFNYKERGFDSVKLINKGKILSESSTFAEFSGSNPMLICMPTKPKQLQAPVIATPPPAPPSTPVVAASPMPTTVTEIPPVATGSGPYSVRDAHMGFLAFMQFVMSHPSLGIMMRTFPNQLIATLARPEFESIVRQTLNNAERIRYTIEHPGVDVAIELTGFDLPGESTDTPVLSTSVSDEDSDSSAESAESNDSENMPNIQNLNGMTPEQLMMLAMMTGMMPTTSNIIPPATSVSTATLPLQPVTPLLNDDDKANIDILVGMGFSRKNATEAYLSCDKNVALAANFLFEST